MTFIDQAAVNRNLDHITLQQRLLLEEVAKCERGEYSPLMSWERFQEKFHAAIAEMGANAGEVCLCGGFGAGLHRCNQREYLVQAFMAREVKVTA